MNQPPFDFPQDLWERNGSLRDVYVHSTSDADWGALLTLARQFPSCYYFQGEPRPLPEPSTGFANRDSSYLLSIRVGKATLNCHFFDPAEIEFDIDPREVDEATHCEVMRFLVALAELTAKPIALTAENAPGTPYLTYEPATQCWSVHPPQFPLPNDA